MLKSAHLQPAPHKQRGVRTEAADLVPDLVPFDDRAARRVARLREHEVVVDEYSLDRRRRRRRPGLEVRRPRRVPY